MIIKNDTGDVWEELLEVDEGSLSEFAPLTHSLIVLKYRNGYLLVFNKAKGHWELAGGMIDFGETARECVIRELKEEANQDAGNLTLVGVMKFLLMPDKWNRNTRIEYGTLFYSEITSILPFKENDEMSQICFWNRTDTIGVIEPIDAKMIEIAIDRIESKLLRQT